MIERGAGLSVRLVQEAARLRVAVQNERRKLRADVGQIADRMVAMAEDAGVAPYVQAVEQDLVVMALAALAAGCGFKTGIRLEEPGRWVVLYVDLPVGQVSWVVPRGCEGLGEWPPYAGVCDGHNAQEQAERLRAFVTQVLGALAKGEQDAH